MELLLELILQFFGEILLQAFFELIAELGIRSFTNPSKKPQRMVLSTIGLFLLGAMAGGLSLLIFPASPILDPNFRLLNLFLTPLVIGGFMMMLGSLRARKGQNLIRLDRFGYAFAFAFGMAMVRYIWAH